MVRGLSLGASLLGYSGLSAKFFEGLFSPSFLLLGLLFFLSLLAVKERTEHNISKPNRRGLTSVASNGDINGVDSGDSPTGTANPMMSTNVGVSVTGLSPVIPLPAGLEDGRPSSSHRRTGSAAGSTGSSSKKDEDPEVPYSSTPTERAADRACWTTFITTCFLIAGIICFIGWNAWETPKAAHVRMHSFEYFILCMLGGILSGLPHTILTPMDVVKCRVQVGEYAGMAEGFSSIYSEAASSRSFLLSLVTLGYRGWAPTFIGYSMQGALKFGLYEVFKFLYASTFPDFARSHRVALFLAASASAEVFADIALCPWEAVKIKMQTTRLYPPQLNVVVPRMFASEGMNAFFKGLSPLWARQVPYTMVKFSVFEKIVEAIYSVVVSKDELTNAGHLAVSLAAGMIAGAMCATVSHPADTLVSKMNQRGGESRSFVVLARELGCRGLWKGLLPRVVMFCILTAMQWVIYDSFKVFVGLPTTGGSKK